MAKAGDVTSGYAPCFTYVSTRLPPVAGALAKHDIIARANPQGDILGFSPPLCITKEKIDMVVDEVDKVITELLGEP